MFEGMDPLPMIDLILAAAETLSQREAASTSEMLDPLSTSNDFEQVLFQEHENNFSTAPEGSEDPLIIDNHPNDVVHKDLAAHNHSAQHRTTVCSNICDADAQKLTDSRSIASRPIDIRSPFKNLSSRANHSMLQTASENQEVTAHRNSERTSQSTKRHVRSASTPGYSLYPNVSHRVCSTHVSDGIMKNRSKIPKRSSFPYPKDVETTVHRGSTNFQNHGRTWNNRSQPNGHASSIDVYYDTIHNPSSGHWVNLGKTGPNRVAMADISNCSTVYGRGRLPSVSQQQPHILNPSSGLWNNLSKPGPNRIALAGISNFGRGRLPSVRESFDRSFNNMLCDENPSFQRVQTSTPISYSSFALNLSLDENSAFESPLDLVVTKPTISGGSTAQIQSSMVLDLRKKNLAIKCDPPATTLQPKEVPLSDEKPGLRLNAVLESLDEPILNIGNVDTTEFENDYTDDDIDPDWMPEGDATLLNELSIYEYFKKYKHENLSENESDAENDEMNVERNTNDGRTKENKTDSRTVNRKLKERGLAYKRTNGTIAPARRVQTPCSCKMRCRDKFSEPVRKEMLSRLLELAKSGQNQFLSSHISVISKVRPKVLVSRRTWSRIYKLPAVGGAVKVCKIMFMATFDITEKKVQVLAEKLILGAGIASDDIRKDNHSQRQLTPEQTKYIIEHIKSFPAEESHYGREKSSSLYLSSDLTISRMYELYQDQCSTDNLIPAHYNTYRLAFNSLNLKFRKPKVDTCNTCDMLSIELKTEKNAGKRDEILVRKKAHQSEAENMYAEKRRDRQRADEDISVRTISFDLQKQLATPYLTCGRAFYSRQLYTYNLTIFETQVGVNVPMCYMWDETRARRGSREIGSCLWNYFEALPDCVEEVVMYSDRCAGQNNNRTILFLMAYVVEIMASKGRKFVVTHKFMSSGHSHMECDTIHSAIERAKKRTKINIDIPSDWNIFIASIKRKTPITVKDMDQKSFLNWLILNDRYVLPKVTTNNESFKFKSARIFSCSTDHPGTISFKTDINASPKEIHLLTPKSVPLLQLQLKPITTVPIQLPTAKLADLRTLLPYVTKKWYYEAFLKCINAPGRGKKAKVLEKGFDEDMDIEEDEDKE